MKTNESMMMIFWIDEENLQTIGNLVLRDRYDRAGDILFRVGRYVITTLKIESRIAKLLHNKHGIIIW